MNENGARPNGWTAPTVILAALSLVSAAGWAWVGISRDNSNQVQVQINEQSRRINDHEREIAVLKGRVDDLRERERERRGE